MFQSGHSGFQPPRRKFRDGMHFCSLESSAGTSYAFQRYSGEYCDLHDAPCLDGPFRALYRAEAPAVPEAFASSGPISLGLLPRRIPDFGQSGHAAEQAKIPGKKKAIPTSSSGNPGSGGNNNPVSHSNPYEDTCQTV